MLAEGYVGLPSSIGDGSDVFLRQGRTRELIVAEGRANYAEATSRNLVYTGMTAVTGTTVVAANNTPIGAAAASIISIYNPLNSGVNAEVLKAWLMLISSTTGVAGYFVYNVAFGQNISALSNNGGVGGTPAFSTLSGNFGKVKILTQTALTGGVGAQALLRPFASTFAGALAATSPQNFVDIINGEIVVPPGGVLSIASPGTGTAQVLVAAFTWQENPITAS